MANEENLQECEPKLNKKQTVVEICKIVTLLISFVMMLLFLFAPCLELDIQTGSEKVNNYINENSEKDDEFFAKYLKAYLNDTQDREITVYDVLHVIVTNYGEQKSGEAEVGALDFSLFTWKYTIFNGNVLVSGLTQFGSHFFIASAFTGGIAAILMLVGIFIRITNLIINSTKIRKLLNSKLFRVCGGVGLLVYVLYTIPFLLATIPAVFLWHPVYSTYLMYFAFTPLFYTIIAIDIVTLIAHFILKSFSRKVC